MLETIVLAHISVLAAMLDHVVLGSLYLNITYLLPTANHCSSWPVTQNFLLHATNSLITPEKLYPLQKKATESTIYYADIITDK